MTYTYKILPRPDALGGGWRLSLLEDEEEVGGGVFPPEQSEEDPQKALQAAFDDAKETALNWVESRRV